MDLFQVNGLPEPSDVPQVLAIGKFDGVHIGHQAILDEARAYVSQGTRLAVMCFEPHPAFALTGNPMYKRVLTPQREKARVLSEFGVLALYVVQFDKAFAATEPEEFVQKHLSRLSLKQIVVGQDFRFGRGGKGDVATLARFANELGIGVREVAPVEENGAKVSSSQIRAHLVQGRVEAVQALLGRPYTVTGEVVHGDKRGRTIGFPTANLGQTDAFVMPASGVYAVSVAIEGEHSDESHWFGVLNAGMRPTVDGHDFRLEVHVLGFDGDLYGKQCRVGFLHRIRDERRFAGLDELKLQIRKDCDTAKELLGLS